jgi:hypothetical protein
MNKCVYCSDFHLREPELKSIEMWEGMDSLGNKYYYLDVQRPEGFIPEPWRNRRLYIRYCPLCGRKLI